MKQPKTFLRAWLLLLAIGTSVCQGRADNITVDGISRNYIVYAPKNLGENRPLLISCHGMNQDANYQKGMLAIESVADTAKFVTVFPNGIDKGWDISGNRDINYVTALIDKMVERYKIDRNRVYLSGFSMGGMFTYHAMNKIADKIAAFAPISGYPMYGGTYTSSRPVPIIHTHGTSDDVVSFSGVQGILNGWIKRNGCSTTPKETQNYRGASHITRRVWSGGQQGTEVVLMEMAGKGHWISNDNGVKTGDEIWRFCKRYSLDMKDPQVRITSPKSELTFVTMGGASETGAVTLTATASDPDGTVTKVELFDGTALLATLTAAPYTVTIPVLTKGSHRLRAVATDNEGRTGQDEIQVNVEEPAGTYNINKSINTEGSVPEGWVTYDGSEKRTGYSDGYTSGCRVFHFTGETHAFDYGLYVRNVEGKTRAGYARYAAKETTTSLTLYPGNYELLHRLANWNCAEFSPVTIAIETTGGKTIAEDTFTPTANVGNKADNSFSGVTLGRFRFDVFEKSICHITFYTADQAWADLVVGNAAISRKGNVTGIASVTDDCQTRSAFFDLQGRRLSGKPARGLYITGGKKYFVK